MFLPPEEDNQSTDEKKEKKINYKLPLVIDFKEKIAD
jgi:hypothetical protein